MFSPLAFPDGRVVYNLSVSQDPDLSIGSFPFELNRQAQVVLYLADGSDLACTNLQPELLREKGLDGNSKTSQNQSDSASKVNVLADEVLGSRSEYRRAILHQLLVFDSSFAGDSSSISTDVLFVPTPAKSRSTTIKTVMCDVTARLLHSMNDLAHEIQDLSTIESPSSATASIYMATDVAARVHARMSMPGQSTQGSSDIAGSRHATVTDSVGRSTTPAGARSVSRHSVASPHRSDRFSEVTSVVGSRDVSRDRSSINSPSITTPTERKKNRSIARSRIVVGALYLQAGLWPDAVKDLSEGTALARSNNDYIWHAKGLEYIIACLLMFGWAGMYFQVTTVRA